MYTCPPTPLQNQWLIGVYGFIAKLAVRGRHCYSYRQTLRHLEGRFAHGLECRAVQMKPIELPYLRSRNVDFIFLQVADAQSVVVQLVEPPPDSFVLSCIQECIHMKRVSDHLHLASNDVYGVTASPPVHLEQVQ